MIKKTGVCKCLGSIQLIAVGRIGPAFKETKEKKEQKKQK